MSTSTPVAEEAHSLIERALARMMNNDYSAPQTPERTRFVETCGLLRRAMSILRPEEAHPDDIEGNLRLVAEIERGRAA